MAATHTHNGYPSVVMAARALYPNDPRARRAAIAHAWRGYMSTTTTETTMVVSPSVMECYTRREAGERPKDIADALGITPSSVSANHKRVKDAITAGKNVVTDGGTVATTNAPTVDAFAIADSILPGGSALVDMVDRTQKHNDDIDRRVSRLREDIANAESQKRDVDAVRALATSAGFDWSKYEAALVDASKPPTTDADADADASQPDADADASQPDADADASQPDADANG